MKPNTLIAICTFALAACGSAPNAGVNSIDDSTTGGSSTTLEATGGKTSIAASTEPRSTGGELSTGGNEATGGDESTGGTESTGGSSAIVVTGGQSGIAAGTLGGDCIDTGAGYPYNGTCNAGFSCNRYTFKCNRAIDLGVCLGKQGMTCVYAPCNTGLVCGMDLGFTTANGLLDGTCYTVEIVGGITTYMGGKPQDCATVPAPCTTRAWCV